MKEICYLDKLIDELAKEKRQINHLKYILSQ
ncbi:hypothetical protein [Clostridium beijerinckii]